MCEYQVDGWNLDTCVSTSEQEAVLFGHAVKAPCVVGGAIVRKIADAFHPVSAPGPGIEERHDPEGLTHGDGESRTKSVARDHLWQRSFVGVEQEIDPRPQVA